MLPGLSGRGGNPGGVSNPHRYPLASTGEKILHAYDGNRCLGIHHYHEVDGPVHQVSTINRALEGINEGFFVHSTAPSLQYLR